MILRHLLYVLRHIIVLFLMIAIFKTVTGIYHYYNMSEASRPFVVNKCIYVCILSSSSAPAVPSVLFTSSAYTANYTKITCNANTMFISQTCLRCLATLCLTCLRCLATLCLTCLRCLATLCLTSESSELDSIELDVPRFNNHSR